MFSQGHRHTASTGSGTSVASSSNPSTAAASHPPAAGGGGPTAAAVASAMLLGGSATPAASTPTSTGSAASHVNGRSTPTPATAVPVPVPGSAPTAASQHGAHSALVAQPSAHTAGDDADGKREQKLARKLRPFDKEEDAVKRLRALKDYCEAASDAERNAFFAGRHSAVFMLIWDVFTHIDATARHKFTKDRHIPDNMREDICTIIYILERLIHAVPDLIRRKWNASAIGHILERLLHHGNAHKLRRDGFRLLLRWLETLQDEHYFRALQLFRDVIVAQAPEGTRIINQHITTTWSMSAHVGAVGAEGGLGHAGGGATAPSSALVLPGGSHASGSTPLPTTFTDSANQLPGMPARASSEKSSNSPGPASATGTPQTARASLTGGTLSPSSSSLPSLSTPVGVPVPRSSVQFASLLGASTPAVPVSSAAHGGPGLICPLQPPPPGAPTMDFTIDLLNLLFEYLTNDCLAMSLDPQGGMTVTDESMARFDYLFSLLKRFHLTTFYPDVCKRIGLLSPDATSGFTSQCPPYFHSVIVQWLVKWLSGTSSKHRHIRSVLYRTVQHTELVHEILRQSFLMPVTHCDTIHATIGVYREWIRTENPPRFMLEPLPTAGAAESSNNSASSGSNSPRATSSVPRPTAATPVASATTATTKNADAQQQQQQQQQQQAFRTASQMQLLAAPPTEISIVHAGSRRVAEENAVRWGPQEALRRMASNAGLVFSVKPWAPAHTDDQLFVCVEVLSLYHLIMLEPVINLEPNTWEHILGQLLGIVYQALVRRRPGDEPLYSKLSHILLETLMPAWIRANMHRTVSTPLWHNLAQVLSSATHWPETIGEWTRMIVQQTKTLAFVVYDIDLDDRPIDKFREMAPNRLFASRLQAGNAQAGGAPQNPTTGSTKGARVKLSKSFLESTKPLRKSSSSESLVKLGEASPAAGSSPATVRKSPDTSRRGSNKRVSIYAAPVTEPPAQLAPRSTSFSSINKFRTKSPSSASGSSGSAVTAETSVAPPSSSTSTTTTKAQPLPVVSLSTTSSTSSNASSVSPVASTGHLSLPSTSAQTSPTSLPPFHPFRRHHTRLCGRLFLRVRFQSLPQNRTTCRSPCP
ncbi:hypothetical protein CAOG_009593 [Capsaspora owczarzaki ATCC 30864]|uniref:Ral GTPase-activating protein subunit alpha/beta N-terminal domain-containing protein n=1 Tax=Capsaspora owczarzaki (strain ATCC 30864) TaxID=595528 RepID=A0A0D2X228_CAPO3|nr:hypothetical protein CAOG_009593 [Capsaspora owczarzaki ATCC 30864]